MDLVALVVLVLVAYTWVLGAGSLRLAISEFFRRECRGAAYDEWCPARGVVVMVNVRGTRGDHLLSAAVCRLVLLECELRSYVAGVTIVLLVTVH